MTLRIAGLATALPPRIAHQDEVGDLAPRFAAADPRQARILKQLYRRSGVDRRHLVALVSDEGSLEERAAFYPVARDADDRGPGTRARMERYACEAPGLAAEAATAALAGAGLDAGEVTHLVTVSCTGFEAPGFDLHLVDALGLDRGVARTHLGFMGCHGALNGLRAAAAYGADPEARVLLCAVELCSLHYAYGWDPEMLVANALFADGAAAVVGWGSEGPAAPDGAWHLAGSGSWVMPDSAEAMTWRIGDHGFRMTLSAAVPDLIHAHLEPWLRRWLGGHGLQLEDVGSWAVHPGGPRIVRSVETALGLPDGTLDVSRDVLRTHGNMSSPTVLFIVERLRAAGAARPCVALGFGPGLVVEAALLT